MTKDPQPPTATSGARNGDTDTDAVFGKTKSTRSTTKPFGTMSGQAEKESTSSPAAASSPTAAKSSPSAASNPKASPSSPSAAGSNPNSAPSSPVVAVGESSRPAAGADEESDRKQFDPWHFGAIPIPPELIKEYDEAMQRFESGASPNAVAQRAIEAGSKVQAYKQGWGKPLSRQFTEDAARSATTQASRVRVRQANARRLALAAVAVLSAAAFAVLWWTLGKTDAARPEAAPAEVAPTSGPLAGEPDTIPPPPPDPPPATGEPEEPAAAATVIATGTEQVPTPSAGSNTEPQNVPRVAYDPPSPRSSNATAEPRTRSPEARNQGSVRPATSAAPAAAAPPSADDILDGPMTRRPKPKKTSP